MNRKVCAAGSLRLCSVVPLELKVSLLVGLLLMLGFMAGCTSQAGAPRWADRQIRPATDTTRLVRNATYLKKIGRLELAVKELEEAHLREPQNLELLDILIQCYEDMGEFDRAQELYEAALSQGGSHPAFENNRCYSLYLRGRLDQAEACFRKVLARWPENQKARNNLGLVLCRQGRETEALTVWREAVSDVEARQRLGQALAALGKEVPPSLAGPPQVQKPPSASPPQASSQPANKVDSTIPAIPISQKPAGMEQHAAVTPPSGNTVATAASSPARSSSLPEQPMAKAATSAPEPSPPPVKEVPPSLAGPPQVQKPPSASPPQASSQPANKVDSTIPAIPISQKPAGMEQHAAVTPPSGNTVATAASSPARSSSLPEQPMAKAATSAPEPSPPPVKEVPPSLAGPPQVQTAPSASPPQASSQPANKVNSTTPAIPISQKPAGMEQHAAVTPPSGNTVATTASSPALSASLPEQPVAKAATSAPEPTPKVIKTERLTPAPSKPSPFLTAQELIQAQIEIKNGNGVQGHARMMGGLLVLDGFNVVGIGNHAHFGIKKTVIAYRAEAARVAQALSKKFFPDAILELKEEGKLSSQTDVRVSLGRDLNPDEGRLAMLIP